MIQAIIQGRLRGPQLELVASQLDGRLPPIILIASKSQRRRLKALADGEAIIDELRAIFGRVDDPLLTPPAPTEPAPYEKDPPWLGGAKSAQEEREADRVEAKALRSEVTLMREQLAQLLYRGNDNTAKIVTATEDGVRMGVVASLRAEQMRPRSTRYRGGEG